jgi:hypothetical protein
MTQTFPRRTLLGGASLGGLTAVTGSLTASADAATGSLQGSGQRTEVSERL